MFKSDVAILLSLIIFFALPICSADALTRDQMMQKEMNCINQQMHSNNSLDWNDVCYTYQTIDKKISSPGIEKRQEVAIALDAYDPDQAVTQAASTKTQEPDVINVPEDNSANSRVTHSKAPNVPVVQKSLSQEVNNFIKHKEHQMEFGTEISHITYQEPIFELKDRGVMYGIYGVYTYRPKKDALFSNDLINMYRLDAKFSYGQVDYTSTSGTIEGIDDYMIEMRAVFGYDYYVAPDFMVTPYLGLGYRRLSDDSSGKMTTSGASGYARVANYFYMPIGVELTHQLDNQWSIGGAGEFDVFLWGQQDSYLSDVDSLAYPDLHNRQKRGMGLRASLKVARLGDKYNFSLEPFIRYWHIKDSDTTYALNPAGTTLVGGLEPNNKSTEIGAKVGVHF